MRYFPVFLDLKRFSILVVGAGRVGLRKTTTLLAAGASTLTLVDMRPVPGELAAFLQEGRLHYLCKSFSPEDLRGIDIAFACTSNREVNAAVSRACARLRIPCNIADHPEAGDFILPGVVDRGDLVLAVSTSGRSPALSRRIRARLEKEFGPEYAALVMLLGRLRPLVLSEGMATEENTALFRNLLDSPLLESLAQKNVPGVKALLRQHLPPHLHPQVESVCHDLV